MSLILISDWSTVSLLFSLAEVKVAILSQCLSFSLSEFLPIILKLETVDVFESLGAIIHEFIHGFGQFSMNCNER